jgi:DNA-binding CsgD family transcriptional regulator
MDLIEREGHLHSLNVIFKEVLHGSGHCVLVCGESGIGKTALLSAFRKEVEKRCNYYEGVCDSLYTPRPLAPIYDVAWQIGYGLEHSPADMDDRAKLFSNFLNEVAKQPKVCVIVFEDIHWADEATLDFIKFMGRRIAQLKCMFILTYRDNEVHTDHPLVSVFGQLSPLNYSRIELPPLSLEAVTGLAEEKGFDGRELHRVSGGNPFYVCEILADYSEGVPVNVRDGILSVYNRSTEKSREIWDLLCVVPGKFKVKYLKEFKPDYLAAIDNCLRGQILIIRDDEIFFKHELFRRAIEHGLSPIKRMILNKAILDLFLRCFEENQEIEKIVHHAKNANDYDAVVKYAPIAAKQAASVGAHAQAEKLLLTAIEFYQGDSTDTLIPLYQAYAYECYLTNNTKTAIVYATKLLKLLRRADDLELRSECLMLLSHLWWLEGDRKMSLQLAGEAIRILPEDSRGSTQIKAMNNIAELKMWCGEESESLDWAQRAMAVAAIANDNEGRCQAFNIMGSMLMRSEETFIKGQELINESLAISLALKLDEHAARAYSNIVKYAVAMRKFDGLEQIIEEGLRYTEERSLEFWRLSILSNKARFSLVKNEWDDTLMIAETLTDNKYHGSYKAAAETLSAMSRLRTGKEIAFAPFIRAKEYAIDKCEWIVFFDAIIGLLEVEWLTDSKIINEEDLRLALSVLAERASTLQACEFLFWLANTGRNIPENPFKNEMFKVNTVIEARRSAAKWLEIGDRYLQAHALFHGSEEDKRNAVSILLEIGAEAPAEKMKQEMRTMGIKGIPRGLRSSTRSNSALLTRREMDILQLLQKGLQNKEIAGRLFLSPKTVDHHISSILFKLDVNSRAKAVSEAARRNLIT